MNENVSQLEQEGQGRIQSASVKAAVEAAVPVTTVLVAYRLWMSIGNLPPEREPYCSRVLWAPFANPGPSLAQRRLRPIPFSCSSRWIDEKSNEEMYQKSWGVHPF